MDIESCTRENFISNEKHWLDAFENEALWNFVPSLNANADHNFQESALVRFTGMLRDMLGPQYYTENFYFLNNNTKEVVCRSCKYTDIVKCQEHETIIPLNEDSSVERGERHTFSIITVPALNDWVRDLDEFKLKLGPRTTPPSTAPKRPLESDPSEPGPSNKRLYAPPQPQSRPTHPAPCHPIPTPRNKVYFVKVYRDFKKFKMNQIYDFVGFLSFNSAGTAARNGIPTIHCISFKSLRHENPLVRYCGYKSMPPEHMQFIKGKVLTCLTQLLCGDRLAAEYLLYHFISAIYLRNNSMVIGKFTLNISRVPKFDNLDFVTEIYKFIELLLIKSHYFNMSVDNMNAVTFTPTRDPNSSFMTSTFLQLSDHTHVVLDERRLTPGRFSANGIRGIQTLSHVIKNQHVIYDFNFYTMKFDCDIPFLVFSDTKLLPSDFHVLLKPDSDCIKTYPEILVAARHFLNPDLLNEIRAYLTLARHTDCEIPDNMQELVQNYFVQIRQTYSNVVVDDLHNLLVLSRLVCKSQGVPVLNEECWQMTCDLEKRRRERK